MNTEPKKRFYSLLNRVFEVMLNDRLREDMDDTLLEKLLGFIQNCSECQSNTVPCSEKLDIFKQILQCTDALKLAEKAAISLKGNNVLSTSITVFALRLMGLFFKEEILFRSEAQSLLLHELSNTLRIINPNMHASSVQDASLKFLLSVAQHPEGALWIIRHNLLDFVFSSFICSSYYVRKTAVNFFSFTLPLWMSPEFPSTASEKPILKDAVKGIVFQIMNGAQFNEGFSQKPVSECCILTLKQCLESEALRTLILDDFQLINQILNYFQNLLNNDVKDSVLQLLLSIYSCDNKIESIIKEIVGILAERQMFVPSLELASAFLKISEKHKPLLEKHLHFILMPLYICAGSISLDNKDEIFHLTSSAMYASLIQRAEDKASCIKLISSCLTALSKLTAFMALQTLDYVISLLRIVVEGPSTEQHLPMASVCLGNRCICHSLLELFSSFLLDEVYSTMHFHAQLKLCEYLLCILSRPSSDSNVLSEFIRLLSNIIVLNAKYHVILPNDTYEKVVNCLCKKLLDNKESVVDNALYLGNHILTGKDYELWKEAVFKHPIHHIIWEIAVHGCQVDFIKASALDVAVNACLIPCYWIDIKSVKNVDEADVMKILCCYFQDPDFFVQRISVLCIHRWFAAKEEVLPPSCKETMLAILSYAVKSLDLDLKVAALNTWQWCIESSSIFPLDSKSNINNYVKFVCDCGLGSSLSSAVEDYDEAVKFKAAMILMEFRKKLIDLGYTHSCISLEENKVIGESELVRNLHIKPVSEQEKMIALENVMNLSTAQQISNICKTSTLPNVYNLKANDFPTFEQKPFTCSVTSFWTCLWSKSLESLLCADIPSTNIFSEDCISLLDDIIAAQTELIFRPADETPDCY